MKNEIAEQPPPGFLVGVDLGQAQDPTAIAVAEAVGDDLHLRHLERLPLGTPYPVVIQRITALVEKLPGTAWWWTRPAWAEPSWITWPI